MRLGEFMMKDTVNSIRATLYERAFSPLSGVFVITWSIVNWRILEILLFSKEDMLNKIDVVNHSYINTYDNFYIPVLFTILITIFYPVVGIVPYWVWERANYWKLAIKAHFESDSSLTLDQQQALREQVNSLVRRQYEYDEILTKASIRLSEYQGLLDKSTNTKPTNAPQSDDQLKKLQEEISVLRGSMNAATASHSSVNLTRGAWDNEYRKLKDKLKFRNALNGLIGTKPTDWQYIGGESTGYLAALDILSLVPGGGLMLTEKGKYILSKFTVDT
jgi:hypothetical protein